MNLLEYPWIPVQRASGKLDWIAPHQIVERDDPPIKLAAARPDFNGALIQFLIGLVQTTTSVDSQMAWESPFDTPPTPEQLKQQFETVKAAFEFDGDGPRFMQDLTLSLDEAVEKNISSLLIDSPGENGLEKNTDHFVKRGAIEGLCVRCASTALFALQVNAPAGGAGTRTGVRGGGPLTSIVVAVAADRNLWKDIWLNVLPKSSFLTGSCNPSKNDLKFSFPWLADIKELQPTDETQPEHTHPAQMYWAMPRRIRLNFSEVEQGQCDICGCESDQLLRGYYTKNYGMNYKGAWRHPLSPYYRSKPIKNDDLESLDVKNSSLPMHPQPGGFCYRHWLGWVLGTPQSAKPVVEVAKVISHYLQAVHRGGEFRLSVFGYDMDNMKARCWYESTMPLYDFGTDERAVEYLQNGAGMLVAAADLTLFYLRIAVRDSWFGDVGARGNLSFVDASFWSHTESAFYRQLERWIELTKAGKDTPADSEQLRNEWLAVLRAAATKLFGDHVEVSPIGLADPQRIAEAHRQLKSNLNSTKLMEAMGFAKAITTKKSSKKSKQSETGVQA